MLDKGKQDILGVQVDALDYDAAVDRVMTAARDRRPYAVSALAVHGVMTGVDDDEHRYRLNHLDLVTPDGQPVRWAMNAMYGTGLKDRVYGPDLTVRVCHAAAAEDIGVFFFGSTSEVLDPLIANLTTRVPGLRVAGSEPSRFTTISDDEQQELAERIRASGAGIVFVGLGCPRQEVFAYELREAVGVPLLAVGAAFDFHAGLAKEPPAWMQRWGLQWLQRLASDPRRLWRRYLILNPRFVAGVVRQRRRASSSSPSSAAASPGTPPRQPVRYG